MPTKDKLDKLVEVKLNTTVSANDPLALFKKAIIKATEKLGSMSKKSLDTVNSWPKKRLTITAEDPGSKEIIDDILFRILNEVTHIEVSRENRKLLEIGKKNINEMVYLLSSYADDMASFSKKFQSEVNKYKNDMSKLIKITR